MKNTIILFIVMSALSVSGCSSSKYNLASLAGTNVRDLEAHKDSGITRTFNIPRGEAFDKTVSIVKNAGLTVFQRNPKKGYIVVMGFKEQVDTTRVGIFFEPASETATKITLSSLSSLVLPKAEKIIFEGLAKPSS
ncbi:MAG: hypothetical protein WCV56_06205 [Candidatus Omnitrophota bacterium]